MKKAITGILVSVVLVAFLCTMIYGFNNIATVDATVTAIEGDEVTLTDINGEMWVWEGAEHLQENGKVIITFNTMGNDNLYDDVIISITQPTE